MSTWTDVDQTPRHRRSNGAALAATIIIAVLVMLGIVAAPGAAHAAGGESVTVSPSCTSLTVKLRGFADKGAVQIVIDGETQTGDADGWRAVGTSFTGDYRFEPDVAQDYIVRVNSYAPDSGGTAFTPGTGSDAEYVGTTSTCGGVDILAAASSCQKPSRQDKQTISLELSSLREHVTYLVEVLDESARVVTHFEFRTAPLTHKTFSGLSAGHSYTVRVTDESNPVLSSSAPVVIAPCAQAIDVAEVATSCSAGTASGNVLVTDLVSGRTYTVVLTPSSARASLSGDASTGTLHFASLAAGTTYTVTVSDDAADVRARATFTTADCATAGTGGSSAAGGSSSTGGSTAAAAAEPAISFTPSVVTAAGASTQSSATDGTSSAAAAAVSTADSDEAAAGPGDGGAGYASAGTAAAESSLAPAGVPAAAIAIGATAALLAALAAVLAILRRRRA